MDTPNYSRALVVLRRLAVVALTTMGCGPAFAQSNGLFDSLFGSFMRAPPPATPVQPPLSLSGASRVTITIRPTSPSGAGGSVAHCVRLCDGGHFPLPRLAGPDTTPEKLCNALCPGTGTRIYWGSQIERAVTTNGIRYPQLDTAFKYRRANPDGCTCNGQDVFGTAAISIHADVTLRRGDIVVVDGRQQAFVGWQGDKYQSAEFTPIRQVPDLRSHTRETPRTVSVAPQPGSTSINFNARIMFEDTPLKKQPLEPEAAHASQQEKRTEELPRNETDTRPRGPSLLTRAWHYLGPHPKP